MNLSMKFCMYRLFTATFGYCTICYPLSIVKTLAPPETGKEGSTILFLFLSDCDRRGEGCLYLYRQV